MKLDQRTRRLAWALAGVVVLALAVKTFKGLGSGGVPVGEPDGRLSRRSQGTEQSLITEVVEVALDALQPASTSFQPGRDPFRFGAKAPPPQLRTQPKPKPPVEKPKEPSGPPPVTKPVPPSIDHLKFLGSFGPERYRIAVVVDGEETHNLAEGDILDGKFVVEKIGFESVEIGFVGFDDASPGKLEVGGGRDTG